MKRTELIIVCAIYLTLIGCSKVYHGTNELLEKAIDEFPISTNESATIRYIGLCSKGKKAIAWFMSGDEDQEHQYLPLEIKVVGDIADYKYVKTHKPIEKAKDIVAINWNDGYCFLINNSKCTEIQIVDKNGSVYNMPIEKDSYPYIFYWDSIPLDYSFLDEEGNRVE